MTDHAPVNSQCEPATALSERVTQTDWKNRTLWRYGSAVALVAVSHVLSVFCWPALGSATHTISLAAVVMASLLGGYGPSILATVLAGADLAYTFIPPYYSFYIDLDEIFFVFAFMAVAIFISSLQAQRRMAEASLRREREGLEKRVVDRTAELLKSQEQLKSLVSDLVTVAEREQQRIGRDLHDGIGQELTGISLFSSALAERLRAESYPARGEAEQVAALVRQSILHTRDLARGLCPVDLEDEGLAFALRRLTERVSRLPGVQCTFTAGSMPALNADTSIHLYRIVQEAINNALRHGHAKTIHVSFTSQQRGWALTVADNGDGFSTAEVPTGMGRRLMQHRATIIGATLEVRSVESGVCVICAGGLRG